MYDPQLMRFTARDPIFGKNKEPLSLHKYLYCQNEPVNRRDPSGRIWDLYTQAQDASASVGALNWAKEVIYSGATWWNAFFSGTMNVWLGPDSVSDAAKFAIGLAAGAVEMQVGLRYNATAGSLAGSLITNTGNELLAKDKSLGWAAVDVAVSTGLGMVGDWMDPSGVNAIEMWLVGVDADLIHNASKEFVDFWSGW
jgi:hypothetical protein